MHSPGMLVAALTEPGLDEYAAMLTEAEEAGYEGPVRVISGDEARELDPALSEAVIGGVHAPSERYVRPESVSQGLAAWLRANGAEVEENTAVDDLEDLDADAVVVAAGAWSGELLGESRFPMEAAKGYSITATSSGTLAAPRALPLRGQGRDEHLRRRPAEDRGHLRPDGDRRVAEAQADRRDRPLVRRLPEDWEPDEHRTRVGRPSALPLGRSSGDRRLSPGARASTSPRGTAAWASPSARSRGSSSRRSSSTAPRRESSSRFASSASASAARAASRRSARRSGRCRLRTARARARRARRSRRPPGRTCRSTTPTRRPSR